MVEVAVFCNQLLGERYHHRSDTKLQVKCCEELHLPDVRATARRRHVKQSLSANYSYSKIIKKKESEDYIREVFLSGIQVEVAAVMIYVYGVAGR